MHSYTPMDWYWIVGGSTTQVWASARIAYVPVADTAYVAWLAAGGVPVKIDTAANLLDVLMQEWAAPALVGSGITIVSTGAAGLNGTYRTDAASLANLTAISTGIAAGMPLPGGGSTFNYPDANNVEHAFTGVNFLNFAAAVEGYIYAFDQALATLVGGGSASLPTQPLTIA